MKAALVLMIGLVLGLMTPDFSEAHKGKQHDRGDSYSQQYDNHRGHDDGWRNNDRHKHKNKAWKKHRKHHHKAKHWRKHHRPTRVIYRDRWSYPLFPGIIIHLPL